MMKKEENEACLCLCVCACEFARDARSLDVPDEAGAVAADGGEAGVVGRDGDVADFVAVGACVAFVYVCMWVGGWACIIC